MPPRGGRVRGGRCADRRLRGRREGNRGEAKTQRLLAETELRRAVSKTTLTGEQITELIEQCADLRDADPGDMASTY
jgi:hypothetical protein